MAKLSDVEFSKKGEAKTEQIFMEPTRDQLRDQPANMERPKMSSGRVIFKLVNSNRNGKYWMDGIADIVNPKTGKTERARLLTGVDTIWMKEQKDIDKDYVNKNRRSLCFIDRTLILDAGDETAVEFARLNNAFVENPKRKSGAKNEYYEWNPARQEALAFEREMLEQEVMQIAMLQPYDKLKKHAFFLGGISFVDEFGEPRTEKGVRTLYVREARRNPERFKKTLDSREVEVAYLVQKAIMENLIDLGGVSGTVSWANNGGFIGKMPQGKNPKDFLVELALLPNDAGKEFLDQLQKHVI